MIKRNRSGVLAKRDAADEHDLWAAHDEPFDDVFDGDELDETDADAERADADRADAPRPRVWSKVQIALAALSATPVLFIGGLHAWPWQDTPAVATNDPAVTAVADTTPKSLSIARLGINTPLDKLTTDSITGVPQVPGFNRAGWIASGVKPGDLGRAVILGRRSPDGADVFAKLVNAKAGDKIAVTTASGKTLTFVVQSVEQFTTGQLPETRIDGGGKKQAQLRLITSTGTYNQSKGGFPRVVVVFADLAK